MEPLQIMVVGPSRLGLSSIEQAIRRLGHEVAAADAPPAATHEADVVVVDARGGLDWDALPEEAGPLLIVADEPGSCGERVGRGRPAAVVLSGRESDGAYLVAIRLCAALRGPSGRREETA
jgi:hypothetical protein